MRRIACFLFLAAGLLSACGPKYAFNLDEHLGICGVGWAGQAKAVGLDYLEAAVSSFLIPEASEEDFAANRSQALASEPPIRTANGFFPSDIILVGPNADPDRAVRYAETAIRRASEIGIEILVLGSSRSRSIPEGFDRAAAEAQFVDFLKRIAPAAEQYGVIVALEPLQASETNFINTVREGAEIARRTGSKNICVIADLFHMMRMQESPEDIVEARDKLVHCHVAELANRTAPGVDGDDFTPYLRALKEIHYTGRMSFECSWQDIDAQLPVAFETMKKQIQAIK